MKKILSLLICILLFSGLAYVPPGTGATLILNSVGYEVDVLMAYGGGVNYTSATINSALLAIGTTKKVALLLRPGSWAITTPQNWSTYTNITIKMPAGSYFTKSGTGSIAFGGPFEAGLYQVFSGFAAGDVTFGAGSIKEIPAEWFATNTTPGTTDMTLAIQAALLISGTNHIPLKSLPTAYSITATLTQTLKNEWKWEGSASSSIYGQGTKIVWNGAVNGTMVILYACNWIEVNNIMFDGNGTAGYGLQYRNSLAGDQAHIFTSHNMTMYDFKGSPGYSLVLGEGDASPGIANIYLYNFESFDSNQGIFINNGGVQDFFIYGASIYGHTTGINFAYGGIASFFGLDMSNNTTHINMGVGSQLLNVYGGYFESGTVLNWENHNGFGVNLHGIYSSQGATQPDPLKPPASLEAITWAGAYGFLNSVGNTWNKTIPAISAAKGVSSINDNFVAGSWTPTANTTIIGNGTIRLGATFQIDSLGGQTRLAPAATVQMTTANATPSVATGITFELTNAGAQNITNFTGGKDGQLIIIHFNDANTTIVHNAGIIRLKGGTNVTPAAHTTMSFGLFESGSIWSEVSRNF